jgi:hypothetical protein
MFNKFNNAKREAARIQANETVKQLEGQLDTPSYKRGFMDRKILAEGYVVAKENADSYNR